MAIDYAALEPETQAFLRSIFRQPQVGPKLEKPKPRGPSEPERESEERANGIALAEAAVLGRWEYQPGPPFELDGKTTYPADFMIVMSSGGESTLKPKADG